MITSGSLARHPPAPPGDLRRAVADRQETGLRWHPTPSHTALGTTSPPSHSKLVRDLLHPVDVWGPAPPKSVGSGGRGWQWGSAKGRTSDRCQASGSDPRAASLSALLEGVHAPRAHRVRYLNNVSRKWSAFEALVNTVPWRRLLGEEL